jgi:hypothetical protein
MRAQQQTRSMLSWWEAVGIERVDLAVKRSATMRWHKDLHLGSLPLRWARWENLRQGEVYIRPARGYPWPLVFLDDVAATMARRVAGKYDAMVVETSREGGCHIWLSCTRPLEEEARGQAQRWIARHLEADFGSVSGEHLGRLAGFKNWKRGGVWVNVMRVSRRGYSWDPSDASAVDRAESPPVPAVIRARQGIDTSASGREWGWICGLLESGCPPEVAYNRLLEAARDRRGHDAERYAQRTLLRALERTGRAAGNLNLTAGVTSRQQ